MLTIYGSGKLSNFGSIKLYEKAIANVEYELFTLEQFGARWINGGGVYPLTSNESIYLVNGTNQGLAFFSGSFLYSVAKLNSNGSLNKSIDLSFFPTSSTGANSVTKQSDGKLLVTTDNGIYRLNSDLTRDTSFQFGNPDFVDSTSKWDILDCDVNSSGKILCVGSFVRISGSNYENIALLNSDGTIDTSFNPGDGFDSGSSAYSNTFFSPTRVKFQTDGKAVVVGDFTNYYVSGSGGIYARTGSVRINPNGTIDEDFRNGSGSNDFVYALDIQSDGKIIMGGRFTSYSGSTANRIVRTNISGAIDPTFNTGVGFNNTVLDLKILQNGKIIVVGSFTTYSGSLVATGSVLLNSDGTIDTSFNAGNGFSSGGPETVSIDPITGKYYMTGTFTRYSGSGIYDYYSGVVRVNTDGTVDDTFKFLGVYYASDSAGARGPAIIKTNDGKYIITGNSISFHNQKPATFNIFRTNSDFSYDTSFNTGFGVSGVGFDDTECVVRSDGKAIFVGNFTSYSGSNTNRIVCVNTDGTKDNTFNTGSGFNTSSFCIALQTDDKVIVGGIFTSYSGSSTNRIVRINTDGTKDNTFNTGSGFPSGQVRVIQMQTDGKILVGGAFNNYSASGVSCTGSVRINSDGTVDTSFNVGSGFKTLGGTGTVRSIVSQSDGKILMAGRFTEYSGSSVGNVVRLNSNGTIDTTFNNGGSGTTTTITKAIQKSDGGYVLICDTYLNVTYNGVTSGNIIGLNNSGTQTFSVQADCDNTDKPTDVIELPDGNLLIIGSFYQIRAFNASNYACSIVKLTPDGGFIVKSTTSG